MHYHIETDGSISECGVRQKGKPEATSAQIQTFLEERRLSPDYQEMIALGLIPDDVLS